MISGSTCRFLEHSLAREQRFGCSQGTRDVFQARWSLCPHPGESSDLPCTLCCCSRDINVTFCVKEHVCRMVLRPGKGGSGALLCLDPDTVTSGSSGTAPLTRPCP